MAALQCQYYQTAYGMDFAISNKVRKDRAMQTYYCYNASGRMIGTVSAINGDEAWAMAKLVQPDVAYLRPEWMVLAPVAEAA